MNNGYLQVIFDFLLYAFLFEYFLMNKIKAPQWNCSRLLVVSQYSSFPFPSERRLLNFNWTPWLPGIKTTKSSLTARCGHMVKFWPIKCKNSVFTGLWGSVFNRKSIPPLFLLPSWNVDVMVLSSAAILGHEDKGQNLAMVEQRAGSNLGCRSPQNPGLPRPRIVHERQGNVLSY